MDSVDAVEQALADEVYIPDRGLATAIYLSLAMGRPLLLEILSDFQITIPELGTIQARQRPHVILTSNRTRELHDALKRRCLYHWIEFPDLEREVAIIRLRAPGVSEALARSVAEAVARLRELDLVKPPGAAEAIDWAQALAILGAEAVEADAAHETLGWAVKNREDLRRAEEALASSSG